jgi:hypothetical protein
MGFEDLVPKELIGELLDTIRNDLEDIVRREVENIDRVFGCRRAQVWENEEYIEFHMEGGVFAGLPSTVIFYEHKLLVNEIKLYVDVLRDNMEYNIARIHLFFLRKNPPECYMSYDILTQHIVDLAHAIIYDMKHEIQKEVEGGER